MIVDNHTELLNRLGFKGHDSDYAEDYYGSQKYKHEDGLGEDDISQDAVLMLKHAKRMSEELKSRNELLDRSLSIINEAIMHGMPVTQEVADVSNKIRGTVK